MTERRLPVKQLVILSICRFAEPIALTSVLPYIPEMMEFFGVPELDIAYWAGLTSGIFSISQGVTSIFWGTASDRYGRKPIILLGLINTMITMLMFGFSTNLPMAMTARALQGLGNGNVGILRTTVAELCPWKELQPRAFSIMPLVYTVGAVIGPTMGGALSNPLHVDPRGPRGTEFFARFPYALPNLAASTFFCVGIVTGFLFLRETLETKKNQRDYGVLLGEKITAWVRTTLRIPRRLKNGQPEREPLLSHHKTVNDEEARQDGAPEVTKTEPPPTIRDVLSYQTVLNLVVYTILAFYILAYDQLLSVFMHHRRQSIDDPAVSLPFKFAGGFGINSNRIGILFTIFAVSSVLLQFLVFPPVARRLGVLRCLRISFAIFPVVFFITPFTALLPSQTAKEVAMVVLLMIRGLAGTFAFPTSTIMLTNSAGSLRVLGTLNGLAVSVSAVGRATGPAMSGSIFSWGLRKGYIIAPFWTLSVISLLALIPTFWLVEGNGFGDDPDSDDDDISIVSASASSAASIEDDTSAKLNMRDEEAVSESEYGEPTNLLSYASTRSSEVFDSDFEEEGSDGGGQHGRRRHTAQDLERVGSGSPHRRRGSRGRAVRRRSSVPIGMGVGFRRLSSNLGSTGVGAGGASWGGT
ncbi:MFS general substrate transporter [Amniculicola lignicola CBS 123094]|uniref:MFS general substrate transporter n=1 Tax=Amniculicola lignicola CBS 123094 TaxID=1392246 RepID=A0A6A5WZX5_9PLEO|nr:MFS general substrate transporter [Amniculicola lignicola CBS 123094]